MKKILVTVERWECDAGHQHESEEVAVKCDIKSKQMAERATARHSARGVQKKQADAVAAAIASGATWSEAAEAVGLSVTAARGRIDKYRRHRHWWPNKETPWQSWIGTHTSYHFRTTFCFLIANDIYTIEEFLIKFPFRAEEWRKTPRIGEKLFEEMSQLAGEA